MQSDDVTRSFVDPGATASAAPSPAVAGSADPDRIREIELLRKLGEGGMGTVWLGRDALLGRDVAVKLLLHATTDPGDPGFRAFLDGARVAASIRSPRLTQIFRADLHDGRPYLVMEFSPGQSLTRLIADRDRFTRAAAYAVMGEVCAAVAELHEHGIVHGDIKPANILVESDGRVVVTDFGLTLSLPREHVGAARAHGGTPRYMAPELFDGKATYQSDVYALGIMFFEMLSGSPPFDGSIAAVREMHKTAPLPWERIDPPVGEMLRDVIERATHREARFRSKSGRHLLDAIRRALPDESTWEAGRADLVSAARSPAAVVEQPVPASTRGSSYYEALEMIARDRATGKGPGLSRDQEPVAVLTPVAIPQLDGVGEHVPCADCGYDLRGVSRHGVCPECGLSIEASLDPARLVFADRAWLTRVRRGMFEVLLAPLAVLLIPGFVAFGAAMFQIDSYGREVVATTMAVCGVIVVMAVWRATPRDPSMFAGRSVRMADVPARRWARLLSVVALVPFVAGQFVMVTDGAWIGPIIAGRLLILAAAGVCWLLWLEHLLVRGWSRPRRKPAHPGSGGRDASLRRKLRRAPIACAVVFALPGLMILGDSVIKRRWQGVTENVVEIAIWLALGCLCAILVCGWAGASTVRRELREAIKNQRHLTGE